MSILCIDVGGSSIKYGLFDLDGKLYESGHYDVPDSLEEFYQSVEKLVYQFHPEGLGLSMPGAVNSNNGIIYGSSAIDYIHGPSITKDLSSRLSIDVEIENDANSAALAEVWKGACKDVNDAAFVIVGTGVGGALIKDKQIHKGKHLHGGEFGYNIISYDEKNNVYHTWSDLSTVHIVNKVRYLKNDETLDGKEIFDNVNGDPIFKACVDEFYHQMAIGLYNIQYCFDPELIVIGGGISKRDDLLENIEKQFDLIFNQLKHAKIRPQVKKCLFENNANLLGALYHYKVRKGIA